ncbi:MAG: DUF1294 domain-containing protein [Lutisporaceae bacterium]
MKYLLIYLIAINSIGFVIMGIDKSKAKKNKWRISEKTIFVIALLGGSIGVKLGMQQYRHKTQHKKFVYGIPAIIIIQLIAALYAAYLLLYK